jgi:uncharacterized membrane protein YjjB (DUF3815 family)
MVAVVLQEPPTKVLLAVTGLATRVLVVAVAALVEQAQTQYQMLLATAAWGCHQKLLAHWWEEPVAVLAAA